MPPGPPTPTTTMRRDNKEGSAPASRRRSPAVPRRAVQEPYGAGFEATRAGYAARRRRRGHVHFRSERRGGQDVEYSWTRVRWPGYNDRGVSLGPFLAGPVTHAARQPQAPPRLPWSLPMMIEPLNIGFPDTHGSTGMTGSCSRRARGCVAGGLPARARYVAELVLHSTGEQGRPSDAIHDAQSLPTRDRGIPSSPVRRGPGIPALDRHRDRRCPPPAGQPREPDTLYAGTGNAGQAQPVELIYRATVRTRTATSR